MNRWTCIRVCLLFNLCRAVGWLPSAILYPVVGGTVYWVLYRLIGYRVGVVRSNLAACFPEKEAAELRRIERAYYRHLSEVIVDTLAMTAISPRRLGRRMRFEGLDGHLQEVAGRNWIAAMAHYGSWEYFAAYHLCAPAGTETVGVYRPLHNKVFDGFYHRLRTRFGLTPVSMNLLLRHVLRTRAQGERYLSIGLIADQTPPFFEIDRWYDFLGRPTAFFTGVETLALRFGMPVYFMHVEKRVRARYTARFECIYDGHEQVAPHEITRRYVERLEAAVRRRPELWMWSHRRWKHTPQSIAEGLRRREEARRAERERRDKGAVRRTE